MNEKELYYLVEVVPRPFGEDSLYLVAAFSSKEKAEGAMKIYQGVSEAPVVFFHILTSDELTIFIADWGKQTS